MKFYSFNNLPKTLFTFISIMAISFVYANDGAFYAKGNQLIPISETQISVKKEVLTLKKINNEEIEVNVYYEFFNPGKEKEIVVGFEAFSPSGDVDGTPIEGYHPYMNDFTVLMNDQKLNYEVAYVYDSTYNQNGIIQSENLETVLNGIEEVNWVNFYYVYHFKAKFKKGLNIIKHTYQYKLSSSVDMNYSIEYVLTAANRWANKQIDDFTLILEMGEFETFNIRKDFFKAKEDWKVEGVAKSVDTSSYYNETTENDIIQFHLREGKLVFKKKDFHPDGELFVFAFNRWGIEDFSYLPFSYYQQNSIAEPTNDFQKKILRNLPFARRGYVFKNEELQAYFEKMDWYMADVEYVPDLNSLSEIEKAWVTKWK